MHHRRWSNFSLCHPLHTIRSSYSHFISFLSGEGRRRRKRLHQFFPLLLLLWQSGEELSSFWRGREKRRGRGRREKTAAKKLLYLLPRRLYPTIYPSIHPNPPEALFDKRRRGRGGGNHLKLPPPTTKYSFLMPASRGGRRKQKKKATKLFWGFRFCYRGKTFLFFPTLLPLNFLPVN